METVGVNGVKFGETSARRGGGNPELSLGSIFSTVGWRQRVAIGAEQSQVAELIVAPVTVHMVEFQRNSAVEPVSAIARVASSREDLLCEQSPR